MKGTIQNNIISLPHTPQYKMHKYFARRPYNVFSNLVSHYTDPGDVILDIFCGGGVTIFEGCKLKRNVIGVDINPLAAFITKMQMFNDDIKELKRTLNDFIDKNVSKFANLYDVEFDDDKGNCKWIEWTYVVECPDCKSKIALTDSNKIKNGVYKCPNSECKNHTQGIARTKCHNKGSIPIRVNYVSYLDGKKKVKNLTASESKKIMQLEASLKEKLSGCAFPSFEFPLNWDRQKEDKLFEKGIIRYNDLFSERNLYILSQVFAAIMQKKAKNDPFTDYLYFLFSSVIRYANKMSKVTENWENGNPVCMDKHAYYLPNTFIENNVVDLFYTRLKAVFAGCEYSACNLPNNCSETCDFSFNKDSCKYWVINGDSAQLPLANESVDIIITDPPYGSNVQYAELSVVWNAWFQLYQNKDNYIYKDKEAVSNRKQGFEGSKTEKDYERLLTDIYTEAYRVLKPDSYMVFTFNNKNLNVWLAMLKAVAQSGFILPDNGVLFQDYIGSYKNTSHLKYAGNVQGDFIYSFMKTKHTTIKNYDCVTLDDLIEESINTVIAKLFVNGIKQIKADVLYKELFSILAQKFMEMIQYVKTVGGDLDSLVFEQDSIDEHLEKRLVYVDGFWEKRE